MEAITEYMAKSTNKENLLKGLIESVTRLEKEFKTLKLKEIKLEKSIRVMGITEEILAKDWNNKYDERWDNE